MLKWIAALSGIPSFSAKTMLIIGAFLALGASATWLREDGIMDTNRKWEGAVKEASLKAEVEIAKRQSEIEKLQGQLALKEKADEDERKKNEDLLSKQQADYPLSAECMRCRVPNERLWLRGDRRTEGSKSSLVSKPGS